MTGPSEVPARTVAEWQLESHQAYASPFVDVLVEAVFTGPSGRELVQPAFYDGNGVWKLRFNPGEAGEWTFEAQASAAR